MRIEDLAEHVRYAKRDMNTRVWLVAATVGAAVLCASAQTVEVPIFEYDPTFPRPLPENWAIGAIGGMAVDRQDHLYVAQRPSTLRANERFTGAGDTPPKADCCVPAPPILEFDQAGTLVRSWGGPGQGYDWPQIEHGLFDVWKDVAGVMSAESFE